MTSPSYETWPGFRDVGAGPQIGSARWTSAIRRRLKRLDDESWSTPPVFLSLFLASALLNVLVGMVLCYRASPHALDWDEIEYWGMSTQILAGHWDLGERRTIAYPLVIAGLRLIDSNFNFVQAGLSAMSALSAPLLYCVMRRLGGSFRSGLLAGVLMALWPAQLFLATSLYSETIALPCFLVFLLALPRGSRAIRAAPAWQTNWRGGAILAGLALGVTAQIRPMYLLFLPFALIIPVLEDQSLRRAARTALMVASGFALVVLPWSIAMSTRHHEVVILTANGGETLAGGLNPRLVAMPDTAERLPNRDTWVGPGKWLPPQDTGYLSSAEMRLPYATMSRLLQQRSTAWIVANPGAALRIEQDKLAYMWGFYPWRGDDTVRLLAGNLPILALLGIALFALTRRSAPGLALARLWIVPLFTTGVALISWGSWRFRQPADAALLGLCIIAMATTPRGVTRNAGAF